MQKKETDKLYIVGLNIATAIEYKDDSELVHSKLLKWIIVENTSDNYVTEFIDIKTNTKYYASAMSSGELFIDLRSLVSMSSFTNKSKLSLEDCNFLLEQFKTNYEIEKQEVRKAIFETIENYSEIFDEEGKIITETLSRYGFYEMDKDDALDFMGDSLEIIKKTKVRKR